MSTQKTLPSRKRRSATLSDHSQTSRIPVPISLSLDVDPKDPPESKASICDTIRPLADYRFQLVKAYITTPKTLPSRKRRSATQPDHSQTSRIPVPISSSLDVDPKDPPESKASVCDTIRPLADFQDTAVN